MKASFTALKADTNIQDIKAIVPHLLAWWDDNRADLPWRESKDPYAVWVAEVMLQQTQISTVLPYYLRWMKRFPTVADLAAASLDEVLKSWEGLGYYGRARHLHFSAQWIMEEHNGQIPFSSEELIKLKGIGPYTAGAIASIVFDERVAAVDGNGIRVISRLRDLNEPVTLNETKKYIWEIAGKIVPTDRPGDFNQALMELGQSICLATRPRCHVCPLKDHCLARARGTQLERPVRPPRSRIPHYHVTAGVIERPDGRLLITQRPLDGLLGGLWEFPGGKQEDGESLPQSLHRELCEELGLDIEIGEHIISIKHPYTHFRITLHVFEARYLEGDVQHVGVIDHRWVNLHEMHDFALAATDRKIIEFLEEK